MYDLPTHDRCLCVDPDVQRARRFPNAVMPAKARSHKSRIVCRKKLRSPRKQRCLLDTHNHAHTTPSQSGPISQPPVHCLRSPVYQLRRKSCLLRATQSLHAPTPRSSPNVTTTVQQTADHVRTTAPGKELRTASTPGSSCRTTEPSGGLYVVCEWNH